MVIVDLNKGQITKDSSANLLELQVILMLIIITKLSLPYTFNTKMKGTGFVEKNQ